MTWCEQTAPQICSQTQIVCLVLTVNINTKWRTVCCSCLMDLITISVTLLLYLTFKWPHHISNPWIMEFVSECISGIRTWTTESFLKLERRLWHTGLMSSSHPVSPIRTTWMSSDDRLNVMQTYQHTVCVLQASYGCRGSMQSVKQPWNTDTVRIHIWGAPCGAYSEWSPSSCSLSESEYLELISKLCVFVLFVLCLCMCVWACFCVFLWTR